MKRILFAHLLVLLTLAVTGCGAGAGGPGPRTWIDAPLDGSVLPLGPVIVQSHAASDGGTAQAALLVNDEQVRLDNAPDTSDRLVAFSQVWNPDKPGLYHLQVVSTDRSGNQGHSNVVVVQVGDLPLTSTPTPAPNGPTFTPTPAPAVGVITDTPTPAPNIPIFIFNVGANCRKGPATVYGVVTPFPTGQVVQIDGRNSGAQRWWWVLIPNTSQHCWASDVTGTASGPVDAVKVVAAPPLPPTVTPTTAAPAPASPTPTVLSAPAAPGNFSVSNKACDSNQYVVRLSWKDVSGETGYRVYRDGALIATLGPGTTLYDDSSPDYSPHSYKVEAFNGSGSASSAAKSSTGCVY